MIVHRTGQVFLMILKGSRGQGEQVMTGCPACSRPALRVSPRSPHLWEPAPTRRPLGISKLDTFLTVGSFTQHLRLYD